MRHAAARCCGTVGMTVTAASADLPSTVAVIVPVPMERPLTSPVVLTVTTALASELHTIDRPGTTAPLDDRGVATSTCDAPGPNAKEVEESSTRSTTSGSPGLAG